MADRIFMAVPRVPWHCEHNVDKKECDICGRPDDSDPDGRRSSSGGRISPAGPGTDGSADSGPGGTPERNASSWLDDAILRSAAFNA